MIGSVFAAGPQSLLTRAERMLNMNLDALIRQQMKTQHSVKVLASCCIFITVLWIDDTLTVDDRSWVTDLPAGNRS